MLVFQENSNFRFNFFCITLFFFFVLFCSSVFAIAQDSEQSSEVSSMVMVPGLSVEITVFMEPDLTSVYQVDGTGTINFPILGPINIKGLTPAEVAEKVSEELRRFILDPQVSCLVPETEANNDALKKSGFYSTALLSLENRKEIVLINGEVKNPGPYEASSEVRLSQMLTEAGGLSPDADPKRIKIVRPDEDELVVLTFDYEQILDGIGEDPLVYKGDRINVPSFEIDLNGVAVLGQVKKTGIYEATDGLTLVRVITKAGGFSGTAQKNKVRVVRLEDGKRSVYIYNSNQIIAGRQEDPSVKAGDMIYVPESLF
jgi:polysaccharide biosynthesis/export protein